MSRHRGRSRPFTARRRYWPRHCRCRGCSWPVIGNALWDLHVAGTLAPRVLSVPKPSGLVDGDVLYMSGIPENVTPPEGWTSDGYGWRKEFRTTP